MSTVIDDVDYGPLHQLIGTWLGNKGLDVSPEPDGEDKNAYHDHIVISPAGAAENAEEQKLVCVQYHQVVRKHSNGKVFHEQLGHWLFEPTSGTIMYSLSIPRAVAVLAGGTLQQSGDTTVFDVQATQGSDSFGIVQSPFMLEKAKTTAFRMALQISGDELSYEMTTSLAIYGREFEHTDGATLQRRVYD